MALRSLGSTLIAKGNPGGSLRKTTENAIETPSIPGKGAPGSMERQFVEQPQVGMLPAGSERNLRATPGISATESTGSIDPSLIPGYGLDTGNVPGAVPGNAPSALLDNLLPAAAAIGPSGRTPRVTGSTGGFIPQAATASSEVSPQGPSGQYSAPRPAPAPSAAAPAAPFSGKSAIGLPVVPAGAAGILRSLLGAGKAALPTIGRAAQFTNPITASMALAPVVDYATSPNVLRSVKQGISNIGGGLRSAFNNVTSGIGKFFGRR